jgi:hypothetical protein
MPRLSLSRDGVTEPRLSRSGRFATRMIHMEVLTPDRRMPGPCYAVLKCRSEISALSITI